MRKGVHRLEESTWLSATVANRLALHSTWCDCKPRLVRLCRGGASTKGKSTRICNSIQEHKPPPVASTCFSALADARVEERHDKGESEFLPLLGPTVVPSLTTLAAGGPLPSSNLCQLLRHLLAGLLQQLDQRRRALVLRAPQREGPARLACTASAPDAMHEVLHSSACRLLHAAEVVDADEGDAWDVQAPSSDIRRNQYRPLASCHVGAELAQHFLALPLLLVAVDGAAPHAFVRVLELLLEAVATSLGPCKDHRALVRAEVLLEVIHQFPALLLPLAHADLLLHHLVQGELVSPRTLPNAYLDGRFACERGSSGLYFFRPCCCEEQCLACGAPTLLGRAGLGAHADDLADGRLEAHVEHLVCLVQDEVGHSRQRNARAKAPLGIARAEVGQAAWRGDQDVHALPACTNLLAFRGASIHRHHTRTNGGCELLSLPGNLKRELTRGREHKYTGARWLGA
mmetsp:Transcript_19460/g.67836  ORF Transcript_19460/g.67836 Transcript_19460/m.67836 type:complete len:459 (-) Transcript_19460:643-2019(-)